MPFVNFAELKARLSIERAVALLGLDLKGHHAQLRGPCPVHGGGDRAFVVTPAKEAFYCFGAKQGGDVIALAAHIRNCSAKDAAAFLAEKLGPGTVSQTVPPRLEGKETEKGQAIKLQPLSYLQPEHEAIAALSIPQAIAVAFESGYAPRGIMRGRYAVPVHSKDGVLLAYVGIAITAEQSPKLLYPNGFDPNAVIFNGHRISEGTELFLLKDPLQLIQAVSSGIPIDSVVSFLGEITALQLEMLASLMDERKIERVELFC